MDAMRTGKRSLMCTYIYKIIIIIIIIRSSKSFNVDVKKIVIFIIKRIRFIRNYIFYFPYIIHNSNLSKNLDK